VTNEMAAKITLLAWENRVSVAEYLRKKIGATIEREFNTLPETHKAKIKKRTKLSRSSPSVGAA